MGNLAGRAVSGGAIALGTQAIRLVLQLGHAAIMARLLTPEDFGIYVMGMVICGLAGIFATAGLSVATVQRKNLDNSIVSALLLIALCMGTATTIAAVAVAPLAGWFFDEPRVVPVIMVLALSILGSSAGAQHWALIRRGMRWYAFNLGQLATHIVGMAVGILLAWLTDIGYWALVAQTITTATLTAMAAWWLCRWRPSRIESWIEARSAVRFGLNVAGFNLTNYAQRQTDNAIIGWQLGASPLGLYSRAYNLMMIPLQVGLPVSNVMVPTLSRLQDEPSRWRHGYLQGLTMFSIFASLVAPALLLCANVAILLVYGPQWTDAIVPFMFLSAALYIGLPMETCAWIFVSRGRSDRLFRWGLFTTLVYPLAFLIGSNWGIVGVAASFLAVQCALAPIYFTYAIRQTGLSRGDIAAATLPFIGVSLATLALAHLVLMGADDPHDAWLRIGVTAGSTLLNIVLYAAVLARMSAHRLLWQRLVTFARTRKFT